MGQFPNPELLSASVYTAYGATGECQITHTTHGSTGSTKIQPITSFLWRRNRGKVLLTQTHLSSLLVFHLSTLGQALGVPHKLSRPQFRAETPETKPESSLYIQ